MALGKANKIGLLILKNPIPNYVKTGFALIIILDFQSVLKIKIRMSALPEHKSILIGEI